MNSVAMCAVALAQLTESIARLILATSRLGDAEQIEKLALAVDRLAYGVEHETISND
jgi:hypothetical protein